MSGRTSGANTTPLGRPNPMIGSSSKSSSSLLKPSYMSSSDNKRTRDEDYDYQSSKWPPDENSWMSLNRNDRAESEREKERERKKKRRSRWGGDEKEKVFIPGLPTVLPNNLNPQQERAYLLQLQIEEISRRLRTGDLGIPPNPEERSPSPEPIYNSEGKRLNTREYRTRKKLEDDRHSLIQEMYTCNPEYKPPPDYKPPLVKVCEKVMIPQEEHPDINFVGLLIGPRGNTLKSMEKETGAKIIIRGKGSVKEGKVGRKDGQPLPGEDEPLHAFVTGNSNESVKRAVNKIRDIIRQGVEVPEGQNDLRRMQLRELALLNGTLRENDGPRCTNCGGTTHRSWQCPDKPNVTNNVICSNCGSAGHISKDCREQKAPGATGATDKAKIDEEYMSLMAELGEGPPPPNKSNSIGSNSQSSVTPLQAPPGPPRAIMAPPPVSTSQYQATSTQSAYDAQNKNTAVRSVPPPTTMMQNNMYMPPPIMSQMPPPPMPPSSAMSPMGMPPWTQPPFQGPPGAAPPNAMSNQGGAPGVGMLAPPPPPPPNLSSGNQAQANWMTPPSVSQTPWQMPPQVSGPMPVPPPPGIAPIPPPAAMASMYPWGGFMGVPPPPAIPAATLQSLAAQPPPPPPPPPTTSATQSTTTVSNQKPIDLPALLAAPPPPPPPLPS
ncbi:splicing factor 1 [Trichonephila inaurata madagascariensis]|uniref:Branchpoint-bridging protein n=1 Tax=Trichonephila inaurata madagascariensis TaxID=2747483 RepID=A0A8X6X2P7_9ARAC|nr:splicing factor 1 [Trichonephila inaurata madagascariensis]